MRLIDVLAELDQRDYQEAWMLVFRRMGDITSPSGFNGAFCLVAEICR